MQCVSVLAADVKEEAPEVEQQVSEPLQIKEEQGEPGARQEGEQLLVEEDTNTWFPLTAPPFNNIKEVAPTEQNPDVHQQELELLHTKEGNERICASQKGEQLNLKEETEVTRFPLTVLQVKSEEVEEKPLFSHFHQQQTEVRDFPTRTLADHFEVKIKEEYSGTAESKKNPHLSTYEGTSNYSETEDSEDYGEDDVNHYKCRIKHLSGSETEDSEDDLKTSRVPESGGNTVKCFSCSKCGEKHASRSSLQNHTACHLRCMTSVCSVNEKCLKDKGDVDSLKKALADSKKFKCKKNLNTNVTVRTEERPFGCYECGKRFSTKSHLKTHIRVHTGQKPFGCDACGKRFSMKSHLKTHTRIHTGEKPLGCDTCGKRFSSKSGLNKHMRIHTGDKRFGCNACGKRFSDKSNLRAHMTTHTGEKPFRCDACGKQCTTNAHLTRHMRIHTGEKCFGCDACGKRFSDKSYLKVHMRVHTGEKPFGCDDCGKRFSFKSSLNKHMRQQPIYTAT
uniref:C2H2-type domain-containing protein n=1 Tax=Fundulus heteroclitus TaxID=8078 RepID=A0A3Q2R2G8_FUNHE